MTHLKLFLAVALTALVVVGGSVLAASPVLATPPEGNTIGKSHSNPDGGGVDKPYAADGQAPDTQGDPDTVADGNNGCGQEKKAGEASDPLLGLDDNNGNCGPKDSEDDGGGVD